MPERSRKAKPELLYLNLLFLGLLWGDLIRVLKLEWTIDDQYQFGFLVPFICVYLLYLRWEDRPECDPVRFLGAGTVLLYAAVLSLYPLKAIYEANPDWRLVFWAHALIVYGSTLVIIFLWGGKPWVRHFALALAIMLFTVPWPTRLEQPLVQGLMRMVAALTVDVLNLLGILAIQKGNVIQMVNGMVGIEEACSGVRSFQSTLMTAYFLGEFYRFRFNLRVMLIAVGTILSFVLNIIRTLVLTGVTYKMGPGIMENWHDPVGHLVAVAAFGIMMIIAWRIRKRLPRPSMTAGMKRPSIKYLQPRRIIPMLVLILISFPAVEWWYRRNDPGETTGPIRNLDWNRLGAEVKFHNISPSIRAILRYSEGTKAVWTNHGSEHWTVYHFSWDEGKISAFSDVHNPEVCMPSAGFSLVETGMPVNWESDGLELVLNSYGFRAGGSATYYVFFGIWNDRLDEPIPLTRKFSERIRNALNGQRIDGRKSLQIIIRGIGSMSQARDKAYDFLERTIVVTAD